MYFDTSADGAALKRSIETLEPIDVSKAQEILKEIKQIMDKLGIIFFLRKGTCLGAVRDNALIPWDDDMDIGSVIGHNGLTEKSVDRVIESLKEHGYIIQVDRLDYAISVVSLKSSIRIDWMLHRIIDGSTFHWPGIRIPAQLLTLTKEIDFLGEKFQVPDPVEDYLSFMYGPEWRVPKKAGQYERDVLDQIPMYSLPGHAGKLKQFIIKNIMPWRATRIKILNSDGIPVSGADVIVAGMDHSVTDSKGYAKLYIPYGFLYSFVIKYDDHEEILYEENISPHKTYVYKADAEVTSGRNFVLIIEK